MVPKFFGFKQLNYTLRDVLAYRRRDFKKSIDQVINNSKFRKI